MEAAQQRSSLAGRGGHPHRAAHLGQDHRSWRPARGGHVRRHVRLPPPDGPQPAARSDDVWHRDAAVPLRGQAPGAELPRLVRVVRRRGHGHLFRRRQSRHPHRSAVRRRAAAVHGGPHHPLRRRQGDSPSAAACGDRRRGDADRLQPRPRRGPGVLAGRPVARVRGHAHRRGSLDRSARVLGAHRDLPVARGGVRAELGGRPRVRPAADRRRTQAASRLDQRGQRGLARFSARDRTGATAPPPTWWASTCPSTRWSPSSSPCPW